MFDLTKLTRLGRTEKPNPDSISSIQIYKHQEKFHETSITAALGIIISAGSLVPAPAHAATPVACSISQHDVGNSLLVTNNTTSTFATGKPVNWVTSNGVKGSFFLQSSFTPGQSIKVSVSLNSGPSCTASVNTAFLQPRH